MLNIPQYMLDAILTNVAGQTSLQLKRWERSFHRGIHRSFGQLIWNGRSVPHNQVSCGIWVSGSKIHGFTPLTLQQSLVERLSECSFWPMAIFKSPFFQWFWWSNLHYELAISAHCGDSAPPNSARKGELGSLRLMETLWGNAKTQFTWAPFI